MQKILPIISLLFLTNLSLAQKSTVQLNQKQNVVCYAQEISHGTRILPPKNFRNKSAKTQAANFEVTYNGFSQEAQDAFQMAVDIWASLISSPVTIRIDATWEALDPGVLGSAGWGTAFRNFEGAKEQDTWYPVALAEKMAGQDLNDTESPDIIARFNSQASWYLGTDGNPNSNQYDFVSVVLHEIGHGLGFVDSFNFENGDGSYGLSTGFPFVFDISVDNVNNESIVENFMGNSDAAILGEELTSNSLFFSSPTTLKVLNQKPRLFAPSTWNPGSSIAHLDENRYPSGDENSLMTPQIGLDEVMQDPGPITLNMFGDMGWEYTYINHSPLINREDFNTTSFEILTSVESDIEYDADSVLLYYSLDEFVSDTTIVFMNPTSNPDEFVSEIPSTSTDGQTYSYFISVPDSNSRTFTRPSLAPTSFFTFTTKVDSEKPQIIHNNPEIVRNDRNNLVLNATIKDFLGIANAEVEYFINDQPGQTVNLMTIDDSDSLYQASVDLLSAALQEGDSIRYRIIAVDQAASSNTAVLPENGLFKVNVIALPPAVEKYRNDFNDITSASEDFFPSDNFRIENITGFDDGAIHSDHPYLDGTGTGSESNYTFELGIPILLREEGAIITFDEVVLVEPGEPGTVFGDAEFWDYVIIEGSDDGGQTWEPFISGYDSRANSSWLNSYNSTISGSNSEAVGDASLFRVRSLDMLENTSFEGGDEILIRLRLFADAAAHGWGWAIDNLLIQVDETPPNILHDHIDFVTNNTALELQAEITDNAGVDSVVFISGEGTAFIALPGTENVDIYTATLDISAANVGDIIEYRIAAFDTADPQNVSYLPSETEFFQVKYVEFGSPVTQYSNDFNSTSDDFVGNYFEISAAGNFDNGAINTVHPYPAPFGQGGDSDFTFTLIQPITIDASNPYMAYDEVLIAQLSDQAYLEASVDNGNTWERLESYTSANVNDWANALNAGDNGTAALYNYRIVKLTNQSRSIGDEILIRFRLRSASKEQAWGWAIDNLEIQTDQVTSLPAAISDLNIQFYPNPVSNSEINVRIQSDRPVKQASLQMLNSRGQSVISKQLSVSGNSYEEKISIGQTPTGIYLVRLNLDGQTIVKKLIIE